MVKAYIAGSSTARRIGYAAIIKSESEEALHLSDGYCKTDNPQDTAYRATLLGVKMALEAIPAGDNIALYVDSELFVKVINSSIDKWNRCGWKKKGGIKSVDVLVQIFELKAFKHRNMVRCVLVGKDSEDDLVKEEALKLARGPVTVTTKAPVLCERSEKLYNALMSISFKDGTFPNSLKTQHYNRGKLSDKQLEAGEKLCRAYGVSIGEERPTAITAQQKKNSDRFAFLAASVRTTNPALAEKYAELAEWGKKRPYTQKQLWLLKTPKTVLRKK